MFFKLEKGGDGTYKKLDRNFKYCIQYTVNDSLNLKKEDQKK
jgi:hypothetical protein